MHVTKRSLLTGVLLILFTSCVFAQEERELRQVSRTYLLTNATVFQGPGRKLEKAHILIKDGLIKSVGLTKPNDPDAIEIKADSLFIYPGFIDGLSRVGVTKPKDETRERPKDPGNPDPERAGITPANDVRNWLNPSDKTVEELRAAGFTVAQVAPYGGMLSGYTAIISLGTSKQSDRSVLAPKTGLYSELVGAQRMYPNTNYAVMAKWRELYKNANLAKTYGAVYAQGGANLERPVNDRILEAFYPIIDKQIPVIFKGDKLLEIQRVLALQKDLGFNLTLVDIKEGWDNIGLLKTAQPKLFLSLELPEEPKKDDKKDLKPEQVALNNRRDDFIKRYESQAAAFQKAGLSFGYSTLTVKSKDIASNLRRMIKAGLTEDQALSALTTTPAKLLGISDRVGSVDPGKIANLVITDKSYFNEKSKIRWVFIDGIPYKNEVKEESKPTTGTRADASGAWSYSTDTPQGTLTGKIVIKKSGESLSGTITSSLAPGESELRDVKLEGNKLTATYTATLQGNSFDVKINVTLDGDAINGDFSTEQFGSFPMKGKRDPKN